MREIKFRAWDKVDKTMHTPEWCESLPIEVLSDPTNRCVYLQYTGLKDKNGEEIYEGDIIKQAGKIGEVFFDEYTLAFRQDWTGEGRPSKRLTEDCEVVGNIYENNEQGY